MVALGWGVVSIPPPSSGDSNVPVAPRHEEKRQDDGLKRDLRLRHMIMIAITGTIGTGLFLISGSTIATAGPGGALLAYILIGIWLISVSQAISEIATLLPLPGAFNAWGTRVFDEAFSFQMTWMYCINWALMIPAQLSASALIVSFWLPQDTTFPPWVVPLIIIILMLFINIAGVKTYGELAYWFSIPKFFTIIFFIACGILVDAGAIGGHTYGFENWRVEGAPFKGGFTSFITTLVSVAYVYSGVEIAGVTAAESRNPHKHVPRAVNTVLIRVAFFYIASIFLLGSIVANNDPLLVNPDHSATRAPFTIVFAKAGIRGAANYMNAIVFTSLFSAINADFYVTTRMLLSLARNGWVHKSIGYINSRGVPVVAVAVVTACSCLSLITIFVGSGFVYQWFISLLGSITFQYWLYILFLHFRFRYCWKAQGRAVADLPYVAWGYPYGNILGVVIGCFCIVCNWYLSVINPPRHPGAGAEEELMNARRVEYIQGILGAWFPWFISATLFFAYKYICGTKLVKAVDADLDTGHFVPSESDKEDLIPHGPRWKRILKIFV
ncbi:MAG: LOW QUALITY PROTEIN: amino acid permease-domain-containing protein [Linnemannia gamsii]|nr:MAG: LOW QUALITY PROTEIN: amino acid permease-domain-containing protein [Linnemannia gamsii]